MLSLNWGQSVVTSLAKAIQQRFVGIRGFSQQNLWRMQQFYELYVENEKLSPLVREISWSHNLIIVVGARTDEAADWNSQRATTALKRKSQLALDKLASFFCFRLIISRYLITSTKCSSLVAKSNPHKRRCECNQAGPIPHPANLVVASEAKQSRKVKNNSQLAVVQHFVVASTTKPARFPSLRTRRCERSEAIQEMGKRVLARR
jgi:hypothetical protein